MFNPDKLDVHGEIQVTLPIGHVVPGEIVMDEAGRVTLKFTDPKQVGVWLRTALDNALVGIQINTLDSYPKAQERAQL